MALAGGTKLGPYEIVSPLGAGGMGEVYRARDTRLDRTVAIKILPAHLSQNHEARQRMDREARAISSLNHPNICTLHDVGHQDGLDYLVMEYLEGQTLADRLLKGPLPPDQVLKHGLEICEGLDKAHRGGVVHRDLKPGNIMLTRSGAKLMDFGLAKATDLPSSQLTATLVSERSQPLTAQGTVVGTFQYMAPEQLEGKEADCRSDIFALGAVLYEMATARPAFSGKTQASVVASILGSEPPPISGIQPMAPPALDQVIKTCLAKDPEERLQTVHDVKLQLRWIAAGGSQPGVPAPASARRNRREWLGWAVAAVLLLGLAGSTLTAWLRSSQPAPRFALTVIPPPGVTFNFSGLFGPPAISPDGNRLAVAGSDKTGQRMLYLRALDRNVALPLPGTADASYPFWSPDGRQVGFFTRDRLKVVDVAANSVLDVAPIEEGRGGTWNQRGDIVFGGRTTGLFRVSAAGGTPTVVTKLNAGEASHRFPAFLPDGDHIAFMVQSVGSAHALMAALSDPVPKPLEGVTSNAAFRDGRIFYVRPEGTLLAQRFDEKHLALLGQPEVVAKPVGYDGQFNYAAFCVSKEGAIVYEEGSGSTSNELALFDRSGKQVGTVPGVSAENQLQTVRVSPHGDRILYAGSNGPRNDVWAYSNRGTRVRISMGATGGWNGIWSPDGALIAYENGVGGDSVVIRDSAGQGGEQSLLRMEGETIPRSWSPDGKYIIFEFHATTSPSSRQDVWIAPVKAGAMAPHALVKNALSYGTDLSPDGKWLAYTSDESGRAEVYVIPFDPNGAPDKVQVSGRWQVSTEGGDQPRWDPHGNELFFTNPSRTALFAAGIKASAGKFEAGEVRRLFDLPLHPAWAFYDIGPQGNIYLFRYLGREGSPLTALLNWRAEKN